MQSSQTPPTEERKEKKIYFLAPIPQQSLTSKFNPANNKGTISQKPSAENKMPHSTTLLWNDNLCKTLYKILRTNQNEWNKRPYFCLLKYHQHIKEQT